MRIYSEVEPSEQTGFQSPCAEFAERSISIDERLETGNPSRILLKLDADNFIFGLKKNDEVLIDMSLKPKNGDLVVHHSESGEFSISRLEQKGRSLVLWPKMITCEGSISCFPIIALIRDFINQ
jgi:SOS-response transcriptional repressor LexA